MVNLGTRIRLIAIAAVISVVGLVSENVVQAAWQERGWSSGQSGYSTASLPDSFAPVWTNTSDTSQVSNSVIEGGGAQCSVSDSSYVATFLYQSNGLARIAIFNALTGSLIWKESTARSWVHCPAIGAGGTSVVGRTRDLYGTNLVRMYDIASGSLMWSRVSAVWDGTTPVIAGGKVLVTNADVSCHTAPPYTTSLGISAMDHTGVIWTAESSREFPPVTDGDYLYMADCNGDIVKRSMLDGSVLWTRTITPTPEAILLAGSHVIVAKSVGSMNSSIDGFVSLNASNGAIEWSYILPTNVKPDWRAISASPAMVVARISGNTDSALSALDIDERQALLALNVANGQKIWARGIALPHRHSGPYIIGSRVFQPMHPNSSTSLFNLADGAPIASNLFDVSSFNAGAPALIGNEMISWVQLSESDTGLKTLALRRLGQNQLPGTTIPSISSVTSSDVSVEWPVVANSGTDIIDYEIQLSSTETFDSITKTVTATTRAFLIGGLTAGSTIYARLRARNSLGYGTWSSASAAAVLSTVSEPSSGCTNSTTPPPGRVGVSINAAGIYTNSKMVKLSVVWPACTSSVTISNDGGFGSAKSFPVKSEIDWELVNSGEERLPKTVYVRFGSTNDTFTDDIILDSTPPSVSTASGTSAVVPSSSVTARSLASAKKKNGVVLRVKASDRLSGIGSFEVKTSSKGKVVSVRAGSPMAKSHTVKVKTKASKIWLRSVDRAGNKSRWVIAIVK
jgi:hypothetical protein